MGDSRVVRVNVSVPQPLKARMDEIKGLPVNWSAVAADAFERKLQELASEKEVKTMEEVTARLKAAADLEAKEFYKEGRKAGDQWARQVARPSQLVALQELQDSDLGIENALAAYDDKRNEGIAWHLYERINPRAEADRMAVAAFWERAIGEGWKSRIRYQEFALGFCEAAVEVWGQVEY